MSERFELYQDTRPQYLSVNEGVKVVHAAAGTLRYSFTEDYKIDGEIEQGEPQEITRPVWLHTPKHAIVVVTAKGTET